MINVTFQGRIYDLARHRDGAFLGENGYSANIYLFKVINRNIKKSCEICSKITIKTPERRH